MRKLLVISEQCWPEGGGGTLATHLIVELLAETQKLEITVMTGTPNPTSLDGVRYINAPMLKTKNKIQLWAALASLSTQSSFLKLLHDSDIVYVPRYCYPILILAERLGKKTVVHLHDYQPVSYNAIVLHGHLRDLNGTIRDEISYELREHRSAARATAGAVSMPLNKLVKMWIMLADEVICVSRRQAEIIKQRMPELSGKLQIIYNPLPDVPKIKKDLKWRAFLYTGGDRYIKGFHTFLKASKMISKKYSDVKFFVTNHLGDRSILFVQRLNHEFNGSYELFGRIRYEELFKLHSNAMALIFPSIWEEPLPYTIMESMLCGTIPIASKVGGIPEMVGGTYAENMLFEPGDAEGLVERTEVLLSLSKERLLDIGTSLRENTMRRFDKEDVRKQLLSTFA